MADIKVNDVQWNGLKAETQQQITRILSTSGLLRKDDVIKASHDVPALKNMNWPGCDLACDIAASAAFAACAAISDGTAAAICYAAATAAASYCHSHC